MALFNLLVNQNKLTSLRDPFLVNAHAELQHLFMFFRSLSLKLNSILYPKYEGERVLLNNKLLPFAFEKAFRHRN